MEVKSMPPKRFFLLLQGGIKAERAKRLEKWLINNPSKSLKARWL
jgi:hypothetical protein